MYGKYDPNLQMFIQEGGPVDLDRLRFLRWLAESNRLEHAIAGPASGPVLDLLVSGPERATVAR